MVDQARKPPLAALLRPVQTPLPSPATDDGAPSVLPPFAELSSAQIHWVRDETALHEALTALRREPCLGFDTESKPTFHKGEAATGPHLIQLATPQAAYLFQVGQGLSLAGVGQILADPAILKVGFGLRNDRQHLQERLGWTLAGVVDLALQLRGSKSGEVGVKSAVAQWLGQSLRKSRKVSTSNWSKPELTSAQCAYAANDAYAALRVYQAWQADLGAKSQTSAF